MADNPCLCLVDEELAVLGPVAERHDAAHPHALLLRGRDLVADALGRDLPLELGEGQQHVQRQPAHRGGGVELLGHRDERDAVLVEDLDDLGEVGQRPGQPVDLVDDHDIDALVANVGEQPLQGRPLHGAARDSRRRRSGRGSASSLDASGWR